MLSGYLSCIGSAALRIMLSLRAKQYFCCKKSINVIPFFLSRNADLIGHAGNPKICLSS